MDWIGVAAGAFVVLAFYAKKPMQLRLFAIASNLLFILYATFVGPWPVLVLHAVLLPLNVVRLCEGRRECGGRQEFIRHGTGCAEVRPSVR